MQSTGSRTIEAWPRFRVPDGLREPNRAALKLKTKLYRIPRQMTNSIDTEARTDDTKNERDNRGNHLSPVLRGGVSGDGAVWQSDRGRGCRNTASHHR